MTESLENLPSEPVPSDDNTRRASAPGSLAAVRVPRWLVYAAAAAFVLLAAAWGVADYRAFQAKEDRATEILAEVGGQRLGSVGGWFIGRENLVQLDQELTDGQLDRLAELGRLGSGHRYTIQVRNWKPSESRRDEIRRKLGKNCFLSPSDH